ncbi:ATP-dependent DNA ligase [Lampropedia cohaerens]|uniref:DNA ligase (ATP) n=1 Tax=Lampropedia cohaerens TaxID=1610491 RepID=A0A0U1PYJ8_9BURK|nr:ATP-dependent DNA ligase [Lampropedia cohaerens]KKW67594.1 ATP-dependent DNA ligase [Lampropedia cohaerens]
MKRFAALYQRLDRATGALAKRAAMVDYFRAAPAEDAVWALWLLAGNKLTAARARIANSTELRQWVAQETGLADWLVDDSYHHVGDLAETLALLMEEPAEATQQALSLSQWVEQRLLPVAGAPEVERRAVVCAAWRSLPFAQRLVFNKLLTGSLRVGVSARLVQQALADFSGLDLARIAQRMLGEWQHSPAFWRDLLSPQELASDRQQPYPFFLASPITTPPVIGEEAQQMQQQFGDVGDWLLEWKWDGIRLQLIRREGEAALWSRGEERLDGRFPEIEAAARHLPEGVVIDGELLAWQAGEAPGEPGSPMPFTALQKRIQRRKPGPKLLADAPVRLLAYDLLEVAGGDIRALPQDRRRGQLTALLAALPAQAAQHIALSPEVPARSWQEAAELRSQARARGVEGLMLKRRSAPYQSGRRRGDWWKWKIAPLTIDAVLLYAQPGHGRRSNLFTDYTFGVWDGAQLVPVAKAYSGLSDAEIASLDRWIRSHTIERFGPVRSVAPEQVFELAFEAVNRSSRHKSGVAVRFPRILRWRSDKPAAEADRLDVLKALAA